GIRGDVTLVRRLMVLWRVMAVWPETTGGETTTGGIEPRVIEFCRFARASGFNAGVEETLDALSGIRAAVLLSPSTLKLVLRPVLCSSKDEWDRFGAIFDEFWCGAGDAPGTGHRPRSEAGTVDTKGQDETRNEQQVGFCSGEASDSTEMREGKSVSG